MSGSPSSHWAIASKVWCGASLGIQLDFTQRALVCKPRTVWLPIERLRSTGKAASSGYLPACLDPE